MIDSASALLEQHPSSILLDPPTSSCHSMYRCVNPMEVLGTVAPTLKLPSLWSAWPRPSSPQAWLREDTREVPEHSLGEMEGLEDIDYDALL